MIKTEAEKAEFILDNEDLTGQSDQADVAMIKEQYGRLGLLSWDKRTRLDSLFNRVLFRFKRRENARLTHQEPRCFTLKKFNAWKSAALEAPPGKSGYCEDCTPSYQAKMIRKKLCNYPNTEFFAERRSDGWDIVGRRLSEDDNHTDTATKIHVTLETWVDKMLELNYDHTVKK